MENARAGGQLVLEATAFVAAPFPSFRYLCVDPPPYGGHAGKVENGEEEPEEGKIGSEFTETIKALVGFRF